LRAAYDSLAKGETFYSFNAGLPELREAIANYHSRLATKRIEVERVVVTGSGMNAIVLVSFRLCWSLATKSSSSVQSGQMFAKGRESSQRRS
jgi:aspartate/methionine/tyrosine aminotransferase